MIKHVFSILLIVMVWVSPVKAQQYEDVSISYADWDKFLSETVLNVGQSDRRPARWVTPGINTKIYRGSQSPTRNEANRLFYHLLSDHTLKVIKAIRKSIEAVPAEIPLNRLHPDERLAFWLNLHNIAVVEAIAETYPVPKIDAILAELLNRSAVEVNGNQMSIRDIERRVMAQWKDPVVIYGFYRGHIGSPSIRTKAYYGGTVWDDLKDNAKEFVTSLRGVQFDRKTIKASVFYKDMTLAFPNFEKDIQRHLGDYATRLMTPKISNATELVTNVEDWTVADLYGGNTAGLYSANNNPAAILGANSMSFEEFTASRTDVIHHYPPHVKSFLRDVAQKNKRRRKGTVKIEQEKSK